ncbi:hypothetical protein DENSPDRAFT_840311 [Dentipellis sp. KUC8613]|nr:hypothetical protein DENSPDRAFT_840311 [Dentipellis sp. KUC8613]
MLPFHALALLISGAGTALAASTVTTGPGDTSLAAVKAAFDAANVRIRIRVRITWGKPKHSLTRRRILLDVDVTHLGRDLDPPPHRHLRCVDFNWP